MISNQSQPEQVIKSGRRKAFVTLYREAVRDNRLSLEARGLFALMTSLPDDWQYSVSGLAVTAGCGRDKVRRLLRELQTVGYLAREQGHGAGGKFASNIYVLQDEAPPLSGNTVNGETRQRETPLTEIPAQHKKDLTEEETQDTPQSPPAGGGAEKQDKPKKRTSPYALQEDAKPVLQAYCTNYPELARPLADLIEIRQAKKAINSKQAIVALLNELDRLSEGRRWDKLLLVRQSVANSWKSVFPLKGRGGQSGRPAPEVIYGPR